MTAPLSKTMSSTITPYTVVNLTKTHNLRWVPDSNKLSQNQQNLILNVILGNAIAIDGLLSANGKDIQVLTNLTIAKREQMGWNLLHICCYTAATGINIQVFQILIKHAKNNKFDILNQLSANGNTPLGIFLEYCPKINLKPETLRNHSEFVQSFLTEGADLQVMNRQNECPLFIMARLGHIRFLELSFQRISFPRLHTVLQTVLVVKGLPAPVSILPLPLIRLIAEYTPWSKCQELKIFVNYMNLNTHTTALSTATENGQQEAQNLLEEAGAEIVAIAPEIEKDQEEDGPDGTQVLEQSSGSTPMLIEQDF